MKYIININVVDIYHQMQYFSNYKTSKHYHDIYNRYIKCSEYQQYNDNYWTLDGDCHNLKGPAFINASGDQFWYVNGELYREDADGTHYWYKNGKLHREGDLPAIIDTRSGQEWWGKWSTY